MLHRIIGPRADRRSHAAKLESLEARQLLAATLPNKILFQDGYADAFQAELTPAVMDNFTVIGGNTTNAALVNQLRSQGKLFLHNVGYNSSLTISQLVANWSAPFNNTLGGQLSGGFDGVEIDEVLPWNNGSADSNKFISALQQLRAAYPDKAIAVYTANSMVSGASNYSNLWNAINANADLHLFEAYMWESQQNAAALPSWASTINAQAAGLINKTVFTLFSAQAGDPGDDSTAVGFLGYLDEQLHTLRNSASSASIKGVGSYVYSQAITTDYLGHAMQHYYIDNQTSYFGDADSAQDIANPQFASDTSGWTLTAGAGGSVARTNYSGSGLPTTHDSYGNTSHGSFGLRSVRGSAANSASYALSVTPGQSYTVSAFVAATGSGNPNSAKVKITTAGGSLIDQKHVFDVSQLSNVEPWKRILFTFQVPAGQSSVNIVLSDESVPAGTTLYWDFIEVEDNAIAPPVIPPSDNLYVVQENFQDDTSGGWLNNFGNVPHNSGRAGTWLPSGHVASGNADNDWRPTVQNQVAAGMTMPTGEYVATLGRVGNQTGVSGVFNMDGIVKFTLPDGTSRPAVFGDKIVGSFTYHAQAGVLGFGFTNNIAALQSYQSAMPAWNGSGAPLMMPTAYNDSQGATRVGISPNISGHISFNPGGNNLYTHAVVDIAENGGAGDGFVDLGNIAPKVDPNSTANRPLALGHTQTIRFEYTVGNNEYDLLQVDQDGPAGPLGFVDILQSSVAGATPNPGGAMPVGKVLGSVEGMFITGASGLATEAWYDDIEVYLVPSSQVYVIQESFQDDTAGGWQDNFGNVPQNAGRPGQWVNSGHVAAGTADNDWRPLVQGDIAAGMNLPTGEYFASYGRTGNQTHSAGVFNMDGIIRFTLSDGAARPATLGEKIVGSFDYYQQNGTLGFGFTDNIAALQSYQASIPAWNGSGASPLMMPTAYNDMQGATRVGISPNISGHISLNPGNGNLFAHAVVDLAENGGAGDGYVDQGNFAPKVDPNSTANRPLGINNTQTIRFEYTIGNSTYDLLQVDQDGPAGPLGFVDILQSTVAGATPNPGGAMPVGKSLSTIQGLFITGANGLPTEIWYDNISVYLVAGAMPGDFNNDGQLTVADIDLLGAEIRDSGNDDLFYDVNDDNAVNLADLSYWVQTLRGTFMGDTDLDGDVDLSDLGNLSTYYGTSPRNWSQGDFDADQDVDLNDLGTLSTYYGSTAPASVTQQQSETAPPAETSVTAPVVNPPAIVPSPPNAVEDRKSRNRRRDRESRDNDLENELTKLDKNKSEQKTITKIKQRRR